MDTFTITTTGNYEVMVNLFNIIASIFRAQGGGFFMSLVKFSGTCALLGTVMYSIFASNLKPLGMWFVSYLVILNGLLLPVSKVIVKDSMTGQFGKVDNVPFGLAVVASGFNQFSAGFTQIIDQAFQAAPGAELEVKEAAASRLSYLQTWFIFGAHALMQMKGIQIANADFANNTKEFVQQCVVIDCLIGHKYTIHDLKHSKDLWGLVSERPSKMRGFAWKNVKRERNGALSSAETGIITCAEGVTLINKLWALSSASTEKTIMGEFLTSLGLKGNEKIKQDALSVQTWAHMPLALGTMMGVAQDASALIKQQLMIDTIVDATERKAVELGAAPNFEARRAYLLQRNANETTGHIIAMTLPYFKTVLEALMYALFMFVFPLSLLPKGWQILSIWAKGCLWVNLWPPLFAILNFFVTEGLRLKVAGAAGPGGGLSIANSVGVYNAAADMASIAGYLSASIPLIAWWIVDRSTYSLVSVAGSMLSSSQSAVATAAQESFAGNYNYGNVSLDNTQGSQTNLFKVDTAPSYTAGHFSSNDGASSMITEFGGEQVINVARSITPLEIDSASYKESQIRDAYGREMGVHNSRSEQAIQQKVEAAGSLLELGKQSSKMVSEGAHLSNQETTQVMQETAAVYNKVKSIADRLGVNEESANQFATKVHGDGNAEIGADIGILKLKGGGGIELSKTESSQAVLQKAADEITTVAKSDEFREAMQHTNQAIKSGSFETSNQDMQNAAENVSARLEELQQHQIEAAKSLSRAQNLSHTIENIKGNSTRTNMVETQAFVNWATEKLGGIEAVQAMAINEPDHLRALGEQYLQEKYGPRGGALPITEGQLEKEYRNQEPEISGQGSGVSGQGSVYEAQASKIKDQAASFHTPDVQSLTPGESNPLNNQQALPGPKQHQVQQDITLAQQETYGPQVGALPVNERQLEAEYRNQEPGVKSQEPEIRGQDSVYKDQESRIRSQAAPLQTPDVQSMTPGESSPINQQTLPGSKQHQVQQDITLAQQETYGPQGGALPVNETQLETEYRNQEPGVKSQEPEIRGQDSVYKDQESSIRSQAAPFQTLDVRSLTPGNSNPLNQQALPGPKQHQVQQDITLAQQRINKKGIQLKGGFGNRQQQFTNEQRDFKKQKLGVMHNAPQPSKNEVVVPLP